MVEDEPGKVGGMLLEDRGSVLFGRNWNKSGKFAFSRQNAGKTALNSTFLNRSKVDVAKQRNPAF